MLSRNIILETDSYKLNHWNQYPEGTTKVFSYFESRVGAMYDETVFFGLQSILMDYLQGVVVTQDNIDEAYELSAKHFGDEKMFNLEGWQYIVDELGGKLPVIIKAVPEGTPVPVGNAMLTIENTDDKCPWLVGALESMLVHVWYPCTVATRSREVKRMLIEYMMRTSDNYAGIAFMLHDFGYRGATCPEAAAIGGAAHLVNFMGTDTLPAMRLARSVYAAILADLAFSVPATEHSVMTSLGAEGEMELVEEHLKKYPTGILSVVADSYNIYNFVDDLSSDELKPLILERDGVFVVRPDSVTPLHPTPESLVVWIANNLYTNFGGEKNSKGFIVLNDKVRILWGDGIDYDGIAAILAALEENEFSAENIVFGMGGGLLQKLDRDTQRFAFKCSAQQRNGQWIDICKNPLDKSKASKTGRLKLHRIFNGYETIPEAADGVNALETVFENGEITLYHRFDQIRERAAL